MTRHPRLLHLLSLWDRVCTRLRRGPPGGCFPDPLPAFYQRIWSEAAEALGASFRPLGLDGYEIEQGKGRTRVYSAATSLDDIATHRLVRCKAVSYKLLEKQGLPIPRYTCFRRADLRPAAEFLHHLNRECVIKPGDGAGGGQGITTGVRSSWQLARAAGVAARYGTDLLIEERIEGDNYRLLYLNGELLDAVLRRPPRVIGDGRSTIRRLLREANRQRTLPGPGLSHTPLTIDLEMRWTLARQGYSLHSVPAAGVAVQLKCVTNENCQAENEPVSALLCPALVAEGARAAAAFGVRLAGVDILATTPQRSLAESGGVVLEVNTCPGLFWHYHRQGEPAAVGIAILRRLLDDAERRAECSATSLEGSFRREG